MTESAFCAWDRPRIGRRLDVPNQVLEMAMRFALWASRQATSPEASDIQAEFNVSRATAYRWRAAYWEAREVVDER